LFDVTVSDKKTGTEVQDRISTLYDTTIIPILDEVLSDMNLSDELIRIDQLELDLGNLSLDNLTDDLRIRLKSKLEDELVKIVYQAKNDIAQKGVEVRRIGKSIGTNEKLKLISQASARNEGSVPGDFEIFEEYLKTGLIPWWSSENHKKDLPQFFDSIIRKVWHDNEVKRILSLLRFRNVRHRLINTFKDSDLEGYFSKVASVEEKKMLATGFEIQRLLESVDKVKVSRKFARIEIFDALIREIILSKSIFKADSTLELTASIIGDFVVKNFAESYFNEFQAKVKELKEWDFSFGKKEEFISVLANKVKSTDVGLEVSEKDGELNIDQKLTTNITMKEGDMESLLAGNAGVIILWPYLEIFFRGLGLLNAEKQFESESSKWRAIQLLHYLSYGAEEAEESEFLLNKLICNLGLEESVPLIFELTDEEKQECENLLKAVLSNWPAYDLLLDKLSWPISILKLPWNSYLIHVKW